MATVAVELYAMILHATGVPVKAGYLGAATAGRLTYGSFATGVLVCTLWGAIVAAVFAKKAAQPASQFRNVAVGLTAISLIVPIGAGATAASTKVALACAHILVAAIVIPMLTRPLRPDDSDRGRAR